MDELASTSRLDTRATPTPILRHVAHFLPLIVLSLLAAVLAAGRTLPGTSAALGALYGAIVGLNVLAVAMSTWSTVLGAAVAIANRLGWRSAKPLLMPPTGQARTALLLPIYEEDAARVFAAARAMTDALACAHGGRVDCFVLSDSQSAATIAAEQRMVALAARPADGGPRIFYRRRIDNAARKAGNIADFIGRWGALYDFMIVLDADSLMSGEALARLVGAMEANPRAGLIQAMCYPVGRTSRFARVQQFNARLHGPLFQRGVAFWQGPRGNFWGHNAIVRISAFAQSCGLPKLPGKPPLGGDILSHDTVEAALLLRAGHDVWMLPDGPAGTHDGSWEETPTNLVDHLDRDRRWCRGNLQHLHVLAANGLTLASLYHLTRGLLHYLYAPLFVAWLGLYALLDRSVSADALLWLVVGMLAVPRLLCLGAAMLDAGEANGFGGRPALVLSFVIDQLVLALVYPTALAAHLAVLAGVLGGEETKWDAQMRGDRGLSWSATARQLAGPLALAIAGLVVLAPIAPLPAILLLLGLFAAVPLAVLTSRRMTSMQLFRTPDDAQPHPVRRQRQHNETLLRAGQPVDRGVEACSLPDEDGFDMPTQLLRT